MKFETQFLALLLAAGTPALAQESIADVFKAPGFDLNRPADRAAAVQRIKAIENAGLERARAKARAMGIPMRRELPDGTVTEIMGLDENGDFLIYTTHNANAGISSAANLVYPAPYNLDGTGVTVGVWDENAVRATHTEFQTGSGSRVTVRDGTTTLSSHATHVAGTVGARGASATRKGMAPNAFVDSYNWTSDTGEMTSAGATAPAQAGKITISNHSYGFATGWRWNGTNWQWSGTGTDQNAYAVQFGQYTTQARDWDTIAFNAPYYLIFKSAGNDNSEGPSAGAQVSIGGSIVTYDPAIHPKHDGLYRNTTTNIANGYENISHGGNAKNIMSVGAANDAVSGGLRSPAAGTLTSFSSRGPTDDGRIKPDIVANGASLSSTESSGDTAYSSKSGTSMSSPSAAGSAALLVQTYRNLFPGGDMRASTLKGLILHTATDIGNPGPDYHYGWGLMDTQTAADLIIDHHANPSKNRMIEDQLTTSVTSKTYSFTWDGSSPIRATICWTDPAGAATSTHDLRTPRLVNDLDLKIIAPNGTQHYPFVMPFVGTWTVASMSAHATTGINNTDNVEQVLIANPGQPGTWTVVIDHQGGLTNNQQHYSLLTSGLSAAPLSMEVARGESPISVGGADGVSGTTVGLGTQLTYTISNAGGGQLELIAPVAISGQQNCSVTVNTQPASTVNGGELTNLVTTITPASGGTWSFRVSIGNNDPDKDPYHWTVTGIAGSSGSVSFTPVADTYIDSKNALSNFGSAGDIRLNNQTGGNPNDRLHMRGFLRFDLSSIPPGTTIESATLEFVQDNAVSGSIDIHEATGAWTEAEATWDNSNNLFGATIYGTSSLPGAAGVAVPGISLNASGLSKVQSWVDTPSGNHGFGVTATDSGNSQNWMSLRSRQHATSGHHPRLTVTYGGSVEAPLMIVSGGDGVISNGGTDSIPGTQADVGTQLTYTVRNLGNANLSLSTPVAATAVSNCLIAVNTQPSGTLAPSGGTDLVLTITPSSAGAWSATVSIANNDADKNPYTWAISGSAFGSHSVTYEGNTSDGGTAPVDPGSPYFEGSTVTVLGNTGGLTKAGFTFAGWNTAANGSGTTYAPAATFPMPGSSVTLHAVWNALPMVDAGPDQHVFMSASSWTPLNVNPGLWLDAADSETVTLNGTAISQWADKSGFSRHATQGTTGSQPTYAATGLNGKGVITFDGGEDLFEIDLDFLAGVSHSAFIVTTPTVFSNIYGAANGSQGANSLHVGFNGNNYRMNYWANDFGPARSSNFVASQANLITYIWNTGVGKQILANGKSEGTNTNAGVIGTMSGGGRIGRTTGHPFFGGDIAEIIIITDAVGLETRQEIEGYLAHKWGLADNLTNDHPYKAAPPDGAAATTTLAGSAMDPDGDPLTTTWTLEDGPAAASFADLTATDPSVTFMQEGVYTLRLTADDGFGTASDEVIITVGPPVEERSVTYSGNGNTSGEVPVDPQSPYEEGSTVTVLDAGTLAKTGHTFTAWNTNANGSGTAYPPGATFTIQADTTLYAQWSLAPVSVVTNIATVDVPEGSTATFQVKLSAQPADNVTVTVARSSGDTGIAVQSGGSLTFTTANWDVWQAVTLAAANDADADNGTAIITLTPDESAYIAADVIVTGIDKDTTLTVASEGNGDTTPSGLVIVEMDAATAISATPAEGHNFVNWTVTNGSATLADANAASTTATLSEPATVQANFTPMTYMVAYDGNENTSGMAPAGQYKVHDVDLILATNSGNLTKAGFSFAGWNTAADGTGIDHQAGGTYTANGPITLYAKWVVGGSLIHEPFNQPAGSLEGQAGGAGLSGNWTIGQTVTVQNPAALDYGDLANAGGRAEVANGNGTWAAVATASGLADAGLLDDGATLWFSTVFQKAAGGGSNEWAGFAFGSDKIIAGSSGAIMQNGGNGFGFMTRDQNVTAASWAGGGNGLQGTAHTITYSEPILLVGKIEWGAATTDDDKITLYHVSLNDLANPGTGHASTIVGGVDQTAFATISFTQRNSGGVQTYDEIRFGATYQDVVVTGNPAPGPVARFEIDGIPAQVAVGSTVTGSTLTALDANDQVATSFAGTVNFSGSAGITGTSANFIDGVLTGVAITPNLVGTSLTFMVDDGDGHTGLATFDVLSLFQDWAAANGLTDANAGFSADPDGDGVTNLEEYAFGMDPNVGGASSINFDGNQVLSPGKPTLWMHSITEDSVDLRAVFARRKDYLPAGLGYTTLFSADLNEWITVNTLPTVLADQGDEEIDAVSITYPLFIQTSRGFEKAKFFRVGVSLAE